jgi:hypothetical protein
MSEPTFHAGAKLAWHEQIVIDRGATRFQLAVAVAITRRLNGRGEARISQDTIAHIVGASVRGVRKALKGLQDLGHLKITARGSGRGRLATYQPIIKRRASGVALIAETRYHGSAFVSAERRNENACKGGTKMHAPFKEDSNRIPSAQTEATITTDPQYAAPQTQAVTRLPLRPDLLAGRWHAVKERIGRMDGDGGVKVGAWLGKVQIDHIEDGVLTLAAPSKFLAGKIEENYSDRILSAWRQVVGGTSAVLRARVIVRPATPQITTDAAIQSNAATA